MQGNFLRRGVVGRVPAFQPGEAARVKIPAGSGILISILDLDVCPLRVVSGGGYDILLTTDSRRPALMIISTGLAPPKGVRPIVIWIVSPCWCKS